MFNSNIRVICRQGSNLYILKMVAGKAVFKEKDQKRKKQNNNP